MNRRSGLAAAVLSLALLISASAEAAPGLGAGPRWVPGEVIVRYAPGTDRDQRRSGRIAAGVEFSQALLLPRTQVVQTDPGQSVAGAIGQLESEPGVLYAEPNWLEELNAVPNDPEFTNLWGLSNTGQSITGPLGPFAGVAGSDVGAVAGWDIGNSSRDTLTAVIDSGITATHPDLRDQLWVNPGETSGNGIDDDNNGFIDDVSGWDFLNGDNDPSDGSGHGTHVAGTVGATGNNGIGVTGTSWDASLLALKVCKAVGSCSISAITDAITYASNEGAKVVNMSLGGTVFSQVRRDAIAAAPDVLFVTSAGNEGNDPPNYGNNDNIAKYPCQDDQAAGNPALPNLICVAATDYNDTKYTTSNYGLSSVDLAAPGRFTRSTWPSFASALSDTFDTVATSWDYIPVDTGGSGDFTGKWERDTGIGRTGRGIADSINAAHTDINYSAAANTIVTSSEINLSGRSGCGLRYWLNLSSEGAGGTPPTSGDIVHVEARDGNDPAWTTLDSWWGNTSGWVYSENIGSQASLEQFDPNLPLSIRFRFVADGDIFVGSGVRIDDVSVICAGTVGTPQFNYLSGTSMATPHVTGIASIVRDLNPGLSPAEVKAKILSGVDPIADYSPAGAHPIVTGGRADLFKTLTSLDLTPPTLPDLGYPEGLVAIPRPQFSWNAVEAGTRYELLLDGQVIFTSFGQTDYIPLTDLAPGTHTWSVRVTDEPGNDAGTPAKAFTYAPAGIVKLISARPLGDRRGGVALKVNVSAAGSVSAVASAKVKSGRKKRMKVVGKASSKRQRAETFTIRLRPDASGKKALKKKRRLKAKVKITFKPTLGGEPASVIRSVKLAAPAKKR